MHVRGKNKNNRSILSRRNKSMWELLYQGLSECFCHIRAVTHPGEENTLPNPSPLVTAWVHIDHFLTDSSDWSWFLAAAPGSLAESPTVSADFPYIRVPRLSKGWKFLSSPNSNLIICFILFTDVLSHVNLKESGPRIFHLSPGFHWPLLL